jgi:hypothetical protein
MKMETPFTGTLAVLGVRGRTGHMLALDGTWTLRSGAPVAHATRVGDVELHRTVIGEIKRIDVVRRDGAVVLVAYGEGASWLSDLLDAGSHSLSMDMDNIVDTGTTGEVDAQQGRVSGALVVRADAFAWSA